MILDKYTDITGKPTLLPKWGYGLTFICDEREVRARDVLYEAYEFRRQEIPCDVIGLEPGWMEKYYDFSLDKEWSKERFDIPFWLKGSDYGTFDIALKNMNFKLSLWLCCDYDLSEYEEMQLHPGKSVTNKISLKPNRLKMICSMILISYRYISISYINPESPGSNI